MELKDFIAKSLSDIHEGVKIAQSELPPGFVIPKVRSDYRSVETGIIELQCVKFEIAIEVEEEKGKSAKLSVVAGLFGGNLADQSKSHHGHSGTLSFSIPIRLPVSQTDHPKESQTS